MHTLLRKFAYRLSLSLAGVLVLAVLGEPLPQAHAPTLPAQPARTVVLLIPAPDVALRGAVSARAEADAEQPSAALLRRQAARMRWQLTHPVLFARRCPGIDCPA